MEQKQQLEVYLAKFYGVQPKDVEGWEWLVDFDAVRVSLRNHDKITISGINLHRYMIGMS